MKRIKIAMLALMLILVSSGLVFAEQAATIEDAFRDGNLSGTIGSYFEYTNMDADDSDFGWATGYLTMKYETLEWNRLKAGARLFVHGELFSDHDNSTTDPFTVDVEKKVTLPELYLNYGVFDDSSIVVGRWAHGKNTHIDDAQSQGAYVNFKEIDYVEITAGITKSFAEIDYDDGEDFGRTNDSQDFGNEGTYGSGSSSNLMFLEAKYSLLDILSLNPYVMHQDGYAGVAGMDAKIETEYEDLELTYGAKVSYYHVDAKAIGIDNSDSYAIFPYAKKGPLEVTLGYASFDDGDALNKPAWLRDYLTILDQQKEYGRAGSRKKFAKVKLSLDKFWTHIAVGDNSYDYVAAVGDRSVEYELQFGYQFTKSLDLNIRLFDVKYDDVDNKDYQKVETRMRFKF